MWKYQVGSQIRSRGFEPMDRKIHQRPISQNQDVLRQSKHHNQTSTSSQVSDYQSTSKTRKECKHLTESNTCSVFPPVTVITPRSTPCSILVIISSILNSAAGADERTSHQITFLSSPEVMMVLSLGSILSHTTDFIVLSWRPTSVDLHPFWRSNIRSRFSWPPVAIKFWEVEISTLRTMCSCARVCSASPV